MEVVGPRTETADHESVALERLVDRRRLMDPPDDRFEVVDIERPRIEISVPADHVERMVIQDDLVQAIVLLDEYGEISALIVGAEGCGTAHVTLAVRRALDQLPELVAIALRPPNVAPAF